MKNLIRSFFPIFLLFFSQQTIIAQTAIHIYTDKGEQCLSFYSSMIDSITYTETKQQLLWIQDSIYSMPFNEIDSITLGQRSELAVIEGDFGQISQIRIAQSGEMGLIIDDEMDGIPSEILMFIPNKTMGPHFFKITYNEKEQPIMFVLGKTVVCVHYLENSLVSFTVVSDSVAFSIDSLSLGSINFSTTKRRAWGDNNLQRNTAAVIQLLSGTIGVAIGSATIAGGFVTEGVTLGSSTFVTMGGVMTVAAGSMSIKSGWQKIFDKPESYINAQSTLGKDIALEWGSLFFSKEVFYEEPISDYMRSNLNKAGIINFIIGLGANLLDFWGKTTTENQRLMELHQSYSVITGLAKNITSSSVTVCGYVPPQLAYNLNGENTEVEYGIIVKGNGKNFVKKINNEHGGLIEFDLEGLSPSCEYTYFTYVWDKTNAILRYGNEKAFTTDNIDCSVVLSEFKVTKAQYKKGAFVNDNIQYDYRFDASVKATLNTEDVSYITEWGYVYEDPNGRKKEIPLSGYGTEYTDSHYAYFRNSAHATARLYGYAYIAGCDRPIYYEKHDFPLDYYMPTATTGECLSVTTKTATVSCTYENVPEGGVCGVEYTWDDGSRKQSTSSSDGAQTITLSGLKPETEYTYRAYIEADGQPFYGEGKSFTTEKEIEQIEFSSCPDSNHPHMIDLGLPSGRLWSCCNLGAKSPKENGDYYAWGETEPKSDFGEYNYQYRYSPYYSYTNIGTNIAGTKYDAASNQYGNGWQMPSSFEELVNRCQKTRINTNGYWGYQFTGPNGNSIFLPASGWKEGGGTGAGFSAKYWTSISSGGNYARTFYFNYQQDMESFNNSWDYNRAYGCTIRPASK